VDVRFVAYDKNPDIKHTCACIHALPGHHNQLSEMVPPAQFFSTMGHFTSMNATSVFMLNLSDLRPVVMSVDYIMQYLWNPSKWNGYTPQAFQASAWVGGCSRMSLRCERGTLHMRCTFALHLCVCGLDARSRRSHVGGIMVGRGKGMVPSFSLFGLSSIVIAGCGLG
jgi:hypothetical protein